MTRTIEQIHELASEHEEEILSDDWFTPDDLAKRWKISRSSVYEIPYDELQYKGFGQGKKLKRRRYRREWVEAYERETGIEPSDV